MVVKTEIKDKKQKKILIILFSSMLVGFIVQIILYSIIYYSIYPWSLILLIIDTPLSVVIIFALRYLIRYKVT